MVTAGDDRSWWTQVRSGAEADLNSRPSRTVPRRTALIRDRSDDRSNPLSDEETSVILRSIGGRDLAILLALYQHRYLDSRQVERLFFSDRRYAQRRLRDLAERRLIHRWRRVEAAGLVPLPSVLLISRQGAALLADRQGNGRDAFIRRADDAWNHCFHVEHDREANGFLVDLAVRSAPLPFEGLYHWLGEATARSVYRGRGARISPDGWGRYLTSGGEVTFFLEWDRSTESPHRLSKKVADYADHFASRTDAKLNNVLFVGPTDQRETVLRAVIQGCLLRTSPTCSFWTTNVSLLEEHGPLGRIWTPAQDGPPVQFAELPAWGRSGRPASDCIGKVQWWIRRPGGGEVA